MTPWNNVGTNFLRTSYKNNEETHLNNVHGKRRGGEHDGGDDAEDGDTGGVIHAGDGQHQGGDALGDAVALTTQPEEARDDHSRWHRRYDRT